MNRDKIVAAIDKTAMMVDARTTEDAFVCNNFFDAVKQYEMPEGIAFGDTFRPTWRERVELQGWTCFSRWPNLDERVGPFSAWGCQYHHGMKGEEVIEANEHRLMMLLFFLEMLDSGDL